MLLGDQENAQCFAVAVTGRWGAPRRGERLSSRQPRSGGVGLAARAATDPGRTARLNDVLLRGKEEPAKPDTVRAATLDRPGHVRTCGVPQGPGEQSGAAVGSGFDGD